VFFGSVKSRAFVSGQKTQNQWQKATWFPICSIGFVQDQRS
jgi:hypothetical protein